MSSKYVDVQAAREALDSLDDYARMSTGVDAFGPRGLLERFIDQVEKAQSAEVEPAAVIQTNTIALKSCPFCGSPAEIDHSEGYGWWQAGCTNCGCKISEVECHSAEDAAKAWNRRPQYDRNMISDEVRKRFTLLQAGGCTCLTKTSELEYHKEWCHYRLASEIEALLLNDEKSND